jgi:hypothetical protein
MDKNTKGIIVVAAVLAAAGAGYYFYTKNNKKKIVFDILKMAPGATFEGAMKQDKAYLKERAQALRNGEETFTIAGDTFYAKTGRKKT